MRTDRRLSIALGLVQLFDILIHAATDQIEPLRVTSNIVILLWLALSGMGRIRGRRLPLAALGVYILLNGVFLATEGFTNAQQDGAGRWMLFLLLIATLSLSARLIFQTAPARRSSADEKRR